MKRILCMAMLLVPAFAMAQTATTLDGTWQISGDVSGNTVASTCVLVTAEGKITGTCTGVDGKEMPVTGTVADAAVKWSYDSVYNGEGIKLSYTGVLNREGTITGTIYVEPYAADGSFTAARKPAGN
jgi:hypothetical protein